MFDDAIPGRWRLAGIGAALTGFLLVSAAIHVSTYDVEYGTRIWFAHAIEAGTPAALRIGVLERPGGRPVRGARAKVSLVAASEAPDALPSESAARSGNRIDLGEVEAGDTGFIEEVLNLPEDFLPGPYVLMVAVQTPEGPDELAILKTEVAAPGGRRHGEWAVVRPACEESSGRSPEGGWRSSRRCTRDPGRLHLYPAAGYLVAHVEGPVHAWFRPDPPDSSLEESPDLLESGEDTAPSHDPVGLPRMLEVVSLRPVTAGRAEPEPAAPPMHLPVDSLGLATFRYEPGFPRGSFLLKAEDEVERIWLRDVPSQLQLVARKRFLAPGEMMEVEVRLRQPNRPVYLDLLIDGAWIGAYSGRVQGESERLGVPLPEGARGLVMLRASLSPDGAGSGAVGAWIDTEPESLALGRLAGALSALPQAEPLAPYRSGARRRDALIDWVAALDEERLAGLKPAEAGRAAAAMLSRMEAAEASAPLLADTTGHKLLAMDAWKERVRRPILGGLFAIGLLALVLGGWLAVSYQNVVKRRILELDLEDDEEDSPAPIAPITGVGWLAPGAALVIVFVAAAAGLIVFLETLRWNRGDVFSARQRDAAAQLQRE